MKNDLISRQALIYKAEHEAKAMPEPFKSQLPVLVAWLAEKIPSEEPELKKGQWDFIDDQMFRCTGCGQVYIFDYDPELPNYCPSCGADMREGDAT